MKKNKPIVSILIPVTKNEATCLPQTLQSVRDDIIKFNRPCEIIVIANACRGTSDVVANEIFDKKDFRNNLVDGRVIHCETPGKMFAVNDGIDVTKGEYLILIDGDLKMDPGSIAWTVDVLNQPDSTVASMHHTPINGTLPKDKDLSLVIQMNAIRRHAFPEKYWLHGAYLGWKKGLLIEGKPLRFPAGKRVHEDNWLTAIIARDYGFKTIRVTKNYMARFLPPQTWDDYLRQQWRYQFAHVDLAEEFPELAKFIPKIREWTNKKYPEDWIDREWREACIAKDIDFDGFIKKYKEILDIVRGGRDESKKLLDKNGVWKQQVTTKDNVILQNKEGR
jgi:glycosyltransferase involved in cell wall biosynthesis